MGDRPRVPGGERERYRGHVTLTMASIGVLGGTFDPIHIGHLAAAEDAAYQLGLDCVVFVPNNNPPHKQNRSVTPADDRVRMVELAIAGNSRFDLSTVELEREGLSYTLDTMRELRRRYAPETRLVFLTGCDSLPALHTWHQPHELLAEFEVAVLDRPGPSPVDWTAVERHFPGIRDRVSVVPIPLLQISAEDVRRRVREGAPIRYYVPAAVEDYIEIHALYR
jgi:nicotinate-nucleotide adenylyltransferase